MFPVARQRLLKWHALSRTVLLTGIVALTACSDEGQSPTMPAGPEVPKQISDGARQGNPHFFFLPPLVKQPLVTGVVDPNVGPSVVICELDAASKCSTIIAQFTREVTTVDQSEVDAPGQVRFNGSHYYAFWNTTQCMTGPCQLDATKNYRIRVMVGSTELGHADVNLVQGQSALKNVDTDEFIGLVDGKKLPLKFRIELGAVDVVAPGEAALVGNAGGEVSTTDGEVSLKIPSNALAAETPITVEKVTEERPQTGPWSDVVELGPDGTTFQYPVTLTLRYDVSQLPPGVPPEALKMGTWVDDHWEEVPGSTLNLEDGTISAPISHFSSYSLNVWPNAVQGAPGPQQLYVGQSTTFSGVTWYYQTVPYQRCYIAWRWFGGPFGGSWRPYERCDTYLTSYQYPLSGGYVTFTSQNPGVMSVAAPGYSISNSNGQVTSPLLSAIRAGSSIMTARFSNVTVNIPYTVLEQLVFDVFGTGSATLRKFGFNQGTGMNVRIPSARASDLTVSFTHSNLAVAGSNSSLVIPAGATQHGITIGAATTAGRDTLVGTAPGYGPDTLIIETGPGRVQVEGWPTSLSYGDSAAIRIRPMNQDSSIIDNAWFTTFTLGSSNNLAFSRNNASITSIVVPDGSSATPVFYVKAIGSGAATMTVTNPWYVTGPYAVTIAPPPVVSINVQPNPAGVKPGETVQLTATPLDGASQPVAGLTLTWQSSNTSIATVDANGLVSGITNGTVTVTATGSGVSGSTTVKVGTPSIAPSASVVNIVVRQGETSTAQVTINNGGGGVLTGLQAGSFSNYYNGSLAPWATATFNTTTAPAIMTITVAPGLNVGPDIHRLRFDVFAPGVNTFTFFSINVTVIAAGITPVNATISPNPGAVGITVPAGSTRTAQIAINNSGTDPLTQLTVGTFSNYFNGSPAPWVTATLNTTTAPAILTITASPPIGTSQEQHRLRFDVMSPGATNSPYTFFNIPVTVTAPEFPTYTLTDLGTLGGTGSSEAVTLNNAGRIVGNSNFAGFYRDANASSLTQVPNHIGDIYWAHGVNEAGVIAWTQPYNGFLWDPATNTRIGPPPGPFANNNRLLVGALNNTGMVLACSDNGAYAQNYVWVIATNTATLIPGSANFCGGRINDAGVAVANADPGAGGNSRLWYQATGNFTMIPSLGGMVVGRDINNSSIAVGGSQVNGKWHAFRYDPATGQTRDLGTLGGLESEAMGINDAGFIVGWSLNAAGQKRGFIWDPVADRMFEIPPLAGYADAQANDINQSGVVVGFSANGNVRRATRWTPQ